MSAICTWERRKTGPVGPESPAGPVFCGHTLIFARQVRRPTAGFHRQAMASAGLLGSNGPLTMNDTNQIPLSFVLFKYQA